MSGRAGLAADRTALGRRGRLMQVKAAISDIFYIIIISPKVDAAMKPAKTSSTNAHKHRRRFGRAQTDAIFETYDRSGKAHQPMICPQCAVVYQDGRWQWLPRPAEATESQCPACRRIRDQAPAGVVTFKGPRLPSLKGDIVQLARHQEQAEKPEHPLNRIMSIQETPESVVINTTDIHLPRRIGQAVRRAYRGKLEVKFEEHGYFVRIDWTSPA